MDTRADRGLPPWSMQAPGQTSTPESAQAPQQDHDQHPQARWWRCQACGSLVTPEAARCEVEGQHEHAFANPHGFLYGIKCFAVAPGCVREAELTERWTWFAGFAWSIALCRGCQRHLGWWYHDGSRSFYGLIRDRLIASVADQA